MEQNNQNNDNKREEERKKRFRLNIIISLGALLFAFFLKLHGIYPDAQGQKGRKSHL